MGLRGLPVCGALLRTQCVALGGWRGFKKGHILLPLESRGGSHSLLCPPASPQLEEQQTLEEAINVATAAMH